MTKNFQAPLNSYNYRCSTVELSDVAPQLRGLNMMKKIGHYPVSTVVSIKPVPHSTWKDSIIMSKYLQTLSCLRSPRSCRQGQP